MDLPKRKHPRLKEYDYSQNGYYFVTVCVKDKKPLLGKIDTRQDAAAPPVRLTQIGKVTDKYIQNINTVYDGIAVDKYIVMPNHIHMIIVINNLNAEQEDTSPSHIPLHTIIRSLKTMITREIGQSIWQDSYYEKVIRKEHDYHEIWKYIDENPIKWQEDELYSN